MTGKLKSTPGSGNVLIAIVTDADVVQRILKHLGLWASTLMRSPAARTIP